MNTYAKFCPNVFVAKCTEEHKKGDIITLTTKYGQEHDCIVFNKVSETNGFFYYSILRADGYNMQERAKAKAERLQEWANNAENRSNGYYNASQEGKDFLALAEPIKIGHHSEKRHRALIDRNWNRMGKCVEEHKKANEYESRADYWDKKSSEINLSMPESIEYYEYKLESAKMKQEGLKNGTIKREHSFSLTYATKEVKELQKKFLTAKKLWGN